MFCGCSRVHSTKGSNAEKVGGVANRKLITVLKEKNVLGTLLKCVKSMKTDLEMKALRKYNSNGEDDEEEESITTITS